MSRPLDDRPTLFLLDGYALIYRAYYAMISRPLTTSSGENTSAPYGLARFLLRLRTDFEPDYLGVAFDAGDSARGELLPEYKATREKMPDELEASLPRCREVIEAFRVPVIEAPGWEADDVIGTLAQQAAERGLRTVIVSGDKDFYQLIDENTVLLNPGRGGPAGVDEEWVTLDNAEERLGVPPHRVTDYLALLGDASDNIPGVPGIGKKTAPDLLRQFGDLETLLERAEEVSAARPRKALLENADAARLSRRLVTIRRDAPVTLDLEALRLEPIDRERAAALFRELEFHNLLRELEAAGTEADRFEPEVAIAETPAEVAEVVAALSRAARVATFAVWAGENPLTGEFVGLAVAGDAARGWYLPFGHRPPAVSRDAEGNPMLSLENSVVSNLPPLSGGALDPLVGILEDDRPKLGHDLKSVAQVLFRSGVRLRPLEFDSEIASYCLDPAARDRSLDVLAPEKLGVELPSLTPLSGTGRSAIGPAEVDPRALAGWAAPRAAAVHALAAVQEAELERVGMRRLFEEIELPLVPVLAGMERVGIAIDLAFFERLRERLQRERAAVREEIHKIAGEEVNLRSVPQMRELLFDRLELPVLKKTKTGASTDESVLEQLAAEGHAVPRLILEYRELDKLDGTYVSKLPQLVDEHGRIHTRFNQTVAATGRLSSSDPNLQNIPIRSPLGREIRKGFVPGPGYRFVGADYSQIELRILAHLSGDEAFVEAFRADRDIHRETAARIFGVETGRVTPAMREQAKTINFATIYGQGPVALARQLGISREEARRFIDQYFERFSGVASYLESMKEMARSQGYVETIVGRRRYIPEIRSKNPGVRGYGERTATNSPIQGSAADLIKLSMIRLDARLGDTGARLLLQVHDELLLEVPPDEIDAVTGLVREEMEGAIELTVPLRVDLGVGDSWYACKFEKGNGE